MTNSPTTRATNPLSPLPPEIRHLIYAAAYTPTPHHHVPLTPNPPTPPPWLPPICALNRATHLDAALWFITATRFTIALPSASQTLTHFSAFLATFPGTSAFDAIRRLKVAYFDVDIRAQERAALWDFLGICAGVRELAVEFRVMNLLGKGVSCWDVVGSDLSQGEVDGMEYLRALGDVVEACGVDRLFEVGVGSLRTVYLDVWPMMMGDGEGEGTRRDVVRLTAMPLVEELAGYLREGFGARGREVDVVIRELFVSGMRLREN
ncbi:hypothetical protein P171DRAFT_505940 [Karstenula rhodostoma CBS 690.94]|uniref:Uncharacterized protein n=1 Tax=Karstenula rhodostoma CBS 690.94 TaxID=1392251 RepID=A0A9P4P524_9PLEO|nr:hypothetical protein P171DRAFT_505940 [Karstenula rhodostoma CBS 690.94]